MINSFVPVDHVVVLTKGPSDSTNILLNYIFQVAHKKQDIGRSAAATVVGNPIDRAARAIERGAAVKTTA
jgi:ABC-type sugar transport system permease subunit